MIGNRDLELKREMGARNIDVGLTAVQTVVEVKRVDTYPGKDMKPHREGFEKQEEQGLVKKMEGNLFQSIA